MSNPMMNNTKAKIISTGSYLPKKIVSNNDLASIVDTSDEWIVTRTGIKQRHLVEEGEFTSNMAAKAASQAIKRANLSNDDIDMIIVATTTPDKTFPSTAVIVQDLLGIKKCFAFDMQAVCSGFVYALATADSMIKNNLANNVLVIGAESMSKVLNWDDRLTCVLFGDGAGAVILSKTNETNVGIIGSKLYSDGSLKDILYTNGGVATTQDAGTIFMKGKEVFMQAVEKMSSVALELIKENSVAIEEIDYFIPHQANIRIIESIAKKLNIPDHKIIITIDKHANTSAATIPLALDDALSKGTINKGSLILMTALGAGITWGACLVRL
jgi:3-oxoacyl-[acyl-carrier-protein] synthase III